MKATFEYSSEKLPHAIALIRRYFNEKKSTSREKLIAMAIAEIASLQERFELEKYWKQEKPKMKKLISRDRVPEDIEELEALD